MLSQVAGPDQRDRGLDQGRWAVGYLGGGLCLALNIGLIQARALFGLSQPGAIRVCFVFCGLWWAVFTVLALRKLVDREPEHQSSSDGPLLVAGFRQLGRTLVEARRYPITLGFLAGYLIFIATASTRWPAAPVFTAHRS